RRGGGVARGAGARAARPRGRVGARGARAAGGRGGAAAGARGGRPPAAGAGRVRAHLPPELRGQRAVRGSLPRAAVPMGEERSMGGTYWVLQGEVARGPYAMEQMLELVRRGAVGAETPVRADGEEEWRHAAAFPELAPHVTRVVPE